jgi:methylase of polypeptide subunit release factors
LFLRNNTGRTFCDIYQESIYGIDVQEYSVERTKILLSLLALLYNEDLDFDFNILQADTLDFNTAEWNQTYTHFDVIVGNPPYVCSRNVDAIIKEKMLQFVYSFFPNSNGNA